MKVAVFKSMTIRIIEADINHFLSSNNHEIIDIKWSSSSEGFSALIMYK